MTPDREDLPSMRPDKAQSAVLVVDDEVLIRMALCEQLRDEGHVVLEAANAAEAQALLEAGAPVKVVLTDVMMPGDFDGLGLARWLSSEFPDIAVVVVSGVSHGLQQTDPDRNVVSFVIKPFDYDDIIRMIGSLMDKDG